jgi:flagellar motor component MotA
MKSLERRFNNISRLNHYWSSYICFAEAVKGRNFSKKIILRHFNALVEKDDYDKRDKKELIKNLLSLSKKIAEEGMF